MKVFRIATLILTTILFLSCKQQPTKNGLTMTWEENFEDSTKLENNWTKIVRGKDDRNQFMSDYHSLYDIESNNLILRGIKNTKVENDEAQYLTGGITTKDKMTFGLGRIEVKARLFGVRSAWPGIWLTPVSEKVPQDGEITLMERMNADNYIYQTVQSDYIAKQKNENSHKSAIVAHIKPDNYNVYAVEIYNDSLKFFINDTPTFTYKKMENGEVGQFPFENNEYYLSIAMRLGGKWIGPVNEQDLPAQMHIDWVRYFAKEE